MLRVMRDSFHRLKWILIAVVAAFVFGFVFIDMGLGGAGKRQTQTASYAARVNGDTITLRDFSRRLYFTEQNYKQMYGSQLTPEMIETMGLPRQVLDSLVEEQLLLQEARRLELGATPEEVRKRILDIPLLNPDGKFVGAELYNRYVTGQLGFQSPAEFEAELARDITVNKFESALRNSIVVSQHAAEAEYRRMNENARIRYVSFPAVRELPTVTVTPAEVEAYYKANPTKYSHGEQRNVKYLLADYARLRTQLAPSEEQLKARYEADKTQFRSPDAAHVYHILVKVNPNAPPNEDAAARAKAESIVQQLRGGADFAKLAGQNSGDPSSAGAGGDMGFVDRGLTVPSFEQAIFSIPLNTISDPIRSPEFGYHIVKVTERRPAGTKTFAEVRGELANALTEQKVKDLAKSETTRISNLLKQKKPANPEEFAANANTTLTSNDSQWFGKTDAIPGLGANTPLATWAFAAKVGEVGEVSATQRGLVVPYLVASRPAGVAALDEVRARVENDAKLVKAREIASKNMAAAAAGSSDIDAVAGKTGIPASDTTVTRQGSAGGIVGDTSDLVNLAMSTPPGQLKGPLVVGDAVIMFQVVEQKRVDAAELKEKSVQYLEVLRQQQARSLRKVMIERLRKAADVEVNEAALRNGTAEGV